QVSMSTDHKGKQVERLITGDPASKVANWYKNKLHPTTLVTLPIGGITIIKTRDIGVVITSMGSGTNIILKRGVDFDWN
ncbi:MAG TPA: hypothetical protein VJX67_20905, partial [Blastocatellia bacterium]|nr:hypothetical protein [Blastocatellia bacterium]